MARRRRKRSLDFTWVVEIVIVVLIFILLLAPISVKNENIEIGVGEKFENTSKITYLGIDISDKVKIIGEVNSNVPGVYEITYKWNWKETKQTITVKDKIPPEIHLNGGNTVYLQNFDNLASKDPGVVVTDNYDTDLKAKRDIKKISDTEYEFVYTATDSSGNISIQKRKMILAKGEVYLTFDDGPSDVTNEVLDILKENNVKATFFIVDYSEEDKPTIQRIIDEGHTLGIHGMSHDYAEIYSSIDVLMDNFNSLHDKILNDFGYDTKLIRFPGGASNTISSQYCNGIMTEAIEEVAQEGLVYYDWNVDVDDAGSARTSEKIYENFADGIAPNRENVVLAHDGYGHNETAEALPKIIDYAKEEGYQFSAISEDTIPVQHNVNN